MAEREAEVTVSVAVVGNTASGKTQLINRFSRDTFSKDYSPTGFDRLEVIKTISGARVKFKIWDTSGSRSYKQLRPLVYRECDVVIICRARGGDHDTNNNTENTAKVAAEWDGGGSVEDWIRETAPLPAVVAVTKCDGGAGAGTSCSARTGRQVDAVFQECLLRLAATSSMARPPLARPRSLQLSVPSGGQVVVRRQEAAAPAGVRPSRLYRHSGLLTSPCAPPTLKPVAIPLSPGAEAARSPCSPASSLLSPSSVCSPASELSFSSSVDTETSTSGARARARHGHRCKVM